MSDKDRARIIWSILISLSVLGFVGLASLCLTLFYKNYADPAVLTAIIAITSGVVGSLSSMAVQKPSPQQPPDITLSTSPPSAQVTQPQPEEIKP